MFWHSWDVHLDAWSLRDTVRRVSLKQFKHRILSEVVFLISTECVAAVSLTVQGDFVPEHVGPPIACCGIKLVDVPEMEYYQSNQQGEICVKGSCVFRGWVEQKPLINHCKSKTALLLYIFHRYFKDPSRTNETIDSHGWHHTGDIGQWLPNGTLRIIDRKKHIFKLSQGEYIVPEKIENIYIKSKYVEQVFVHGESLKVWQLIFAVFVYWASLVTKIHHHYRVASLP